MNLTESITLEQVTEEIRVLQEDLGHYLDEYEGLARKLDTFVKLLNTDKEQSHNLRDDFQVE